VLILLHEGFKVSQSGLLLFVGFQLLSILLTQVFLYSNIILFVYFIYKGLHLWGDEYPIKRKGAVVSICTFAEICAG
jgi:hypothetical protein